MNYICTCDKIFNLADGLAYIAHVMTRYLKNVIIMLMMAGYTAPPLTGTECA